MECNDIDMFIKAIFIAVAITGLLAMYTMGTGFYRMEKELKRQRKLKENLEDELSEEEDDDEDEPEKSIEQRADEFADMEYCVASPYNALDMWRWRREGYIKGSIEQQRIDLKHSYKNMKETMNAILERRSQPPIGPEDRDVFIELYMKHSTPPERTEPYDKDYLDEKIRQATPKWKDTNTEQFIKDIRDEG